MCTVWMMKNIYSLRGASLSFSFLASFLLIFDIMGNMLFCFSVSYELFIFLFSISVRLLLLLRIGSFVVPSPSCVRSNKQQQVKISSCR